MRVPQKLASQHVTHFEVIMGNLCAGDFGKKKRSGLVQSDV